MEPTLKNQQPTLKEILERLKTNPDLIIGSLVAYLTQNPNLLEHLLSNLDLEQIVTILSRRTNGAVGHPPLEEREEAELDPLAAISAFTPQAIKDAIHGILIPEENPMENYNENGNSLEPTTTANPEKAAKPEGADEEENPINQELQAKLNLFFQIARINREENQTKPLGGNAIALLVNLILKDPTLLKQVIAATEGNEQEILNEKDIKKKFEMLTKSLPSIENRLPEILSAQEPEDTVALETKELTAEELYYVLTILFNLSGPEIYEFANKTLSLKNKLPDTSRGFNPQEQTHITPIEICTTIIQNRPNATLNKIRNRIEKYRNDHQK